MTEKTPGKLTPVQSALRLVKTIFPLVGLAKAYSKLTRSIASGAHHFQFLVEWGVDNPEFFDHYIDEFYAWKKTRNSLPWERGVYSSFALQATTHGDQKPTVLELCSGDGFMAYHFYSLLAESVVAVDFDKDAYRFSKRNSQADNIRFIHGDIRTDIPDGLYDNIIWDQAIEHFTEAETEALMGTIVSRLKPDGIFSGDTIVERHDGTKRLHQHEYEFHDKEDLARFFTPYFKHVQVFETTFPTRTNLYFYASNTALPFDRDVSVTLTQK